MYQSITDRENIYKILSKNVFLNIYSIGDLDDFYWENSKYFYNPHGDSIILMYRDEISTVVIAINDSVAGHTSISPNICELLSERFYGHLTYDYRDLFKEWYNLQSHGKHYKMGLVDKGKLSSFDSTDVIRLTSSDSVELQEFYDRNFPGNWFNERMLETNKFFGVKENGAIVSVSGIHVYSAKYRVAALGNIVTSEKNRRKGLALKTIARQCLDLCESVEHIGLNVSAQNTAAIKCYGKLGFEVVGEYEEVTVTKRKSEALSP